MSVIIEATANELVKIFAGTGQSLPRHGEDATAIELLQFLHLLAQKEKLSTPKLNQYIAKEYPPIDFARYVRHIMREITDCKDGYEPDLTEYSLEEYQELCQNVFPKIVLETYPVPQNTLDPHQNLFATWALELGDLVRDEISHGSNKLRMVMRIIRDYMDLGVHAWPECLSVWFFKNWNEFLLTRQWPDRTPELEAQLAEVQEYCNDLEKVNLHQAKRIDALKRAVQDQYITITGAVNALLIAAMDRKPLEQEVNTLARRISRKIENLPHIPGKQGAKYYFITDILVYFREDKDLRLSDAEILNVLLHNATPKSEIDADKSRTK